MKTKIAYKDIEIHTVPLERLVLDQDNTKDNFLLLDDVNEKRWKITFKRLHGLKITATDYRGLDFRKGVGNFPDECFTKGKNFPHCHKYIMEVIDSPWIKELKNTLGEKPSAEDLESINGTRHFLLPLYDNVIEIIAWDLQLEEYKSD